MEKKWRSSTISIMDEIPETERFNKYFLRHIHLSKQHANQDFTCDQCQREFRNSSLYSLAWTPAELPHYYTYCTDCLKRMPRGLNHWKKLTKSEEIMPKKKTTKKTTKKTKNLTDKLKNPASLLETQTEIETKPIKKSTTDYYRCLLAKSQQGLKPSLAACCHDCKVNGQSLVAQRSQEIEKLAEAYKQIGISLSNLLQPL